MLHNLQEQKFLHPYTKRKVREGDFADQELKQVKLIIATGMEVWISQKMTIMTE